MLHLSYELHQPTTVSIPVQSFVELETNAIRSWSLNVRHSRNYKAIFRAAPNVCST